MREYFMGLYFKCQSDEHTVAMIPAVHRSKEGQSSSVQIITDNGALCIECAYKDFSIEKNSTIRVGKSIFGTDGITLVINTPTCSASGCVRFGTLTPIKYDIMGPFRYVPFMQCKHRVLSMAHSVDGEFRINGERYAFNNSLGYIEGDLGHSFPREYAWAQCHFDGGSIMLSVADIPIAGFRFTGVISVVYLNGKEYRLATYLGAKAIKIANGEIIIRQGDYLLTAKLIEKHSHPLLAPKGGSMIRIIHESASCLSFFSFERKGEVLLSLESSRAAFEYEYSH